ncbi:unnamed protein product [Spirodela intermedia]|uniref:WRKY domain-containing protein n=1 Tax=Spirodela intermedia TaxID=51605 RepID=A0A7I8J3T7_SPIIN|nr:unnamed protein product [Spirodela intermedia]CAA6664051.1 unnamed protein product [Spirodela intermedia]
MTSSEPLLTSKSLTAVAPSAFHRPSPPPSVRETKGRKVRVAFHTRSHVDILDDGYRWRKSYYRCTHNGCGVKKQVQRLSKDEEVVVTTYEGMHSHPIQMPTDSFERILRRMDLLANFHPHGAQHGAILSIEG